MSEIESFGEYYARLLMVENATAAWELIVERDEAQREAGRAEAEPDVFKRVFGVATPEPPSLVERLSEMLAANKEFGTDVSIHNTIEHAAWMTLAEAVDALIARVRSLETSVR